jgi:hypothetical protein
METYLELQADVIRLGDIEQLHQLFTDGIQPFHIVLASRPELYPIHLTSQADHGPTNLITLLDLFTHQRHRQEAPATIQQRRVVLHGKDPLAAFGIGLIFPHGLDPGLEEVVVRVALEFRRGFEPVEIPAEGLDRIELADDGQASFIVI